MDSAPDRIVNAICPFCSERAPDAEHLVAILWHAGQPSSATAFFPHPRCARLTFRPTLELDPDADARCSVCASKLDAQDELIISEVSGSTERKPRFATHLRCLFRRVDPGWMEVFGSPFFRADDNTLSEPADPPASMIDEQPSA